MVSGENGLGGEWYISKDSRTFAPGRGGDFLHTSLVILTVWSRGRRLKRPSLSPNQYFYNVWSTS